jgi:hypothetical protein
MTREELISKIRKLAPEIIKKRNQAELSSVEFDELTKFPELKQIIIDLLTTDFDKFLTSIDWVSPRPTTFRINLKNNREFYIIYGKRSWIAQVEGKKYYLMNLPEEERAVSAISNILRYGAKIDNSTQSDADMVADMGNETPNKEKPEETTSPEEETPEL